MTVVSLWFNRPTTRSAGKTITRELRRRAFGRNTAVNRAGVGERLASVCPGTGWHSAVPAGRVTFKIPSITGRNGTGRYALVPLKPRISALLTAGSGFKSLTAHQADSQAARPTWVFSSPGSDFSGSGALSRRGPVTTSVTKVNISRVHAQVGGCVGRHRSGDWRGRTFRWCGVECLVDGVAGGLSFIWVWVAVDGGFGLAGAGTVTPLMVAVGVGRIVGPESRED